MLSKRYERCSNYLLLNSNTSIKKFEKLWKISKIIKKSWKLGKKSSFLAKNEHKFPLGQSKIFSRNSHIACALRIYPVTTFRVSVFGSLPVVDFFSETNTEFLQKQDWPKVNVFCPTLTLRDLLKMAKIKQSKFFRLCWSHLAGSVEFTNSFIPPLSSFMAMRPNRHFWKMFLQVFKFGCFAEDYNHFCEENEIYFLMQNLMLNQLRPI